MSNVRMNCDVFVPPDCMLGEFANAFRVMPEIGSDCILDFLVFSAHAMQAKVVARVRVRREFLPVLQDRLRESLVEMDCGDAAAIEGQQLMVRGSTATTTNGDLVVFGMQSNDEGGEN